MRREQIAARLRRAEDRHSNELMDTDERERAWASVVRLRRLLSKAR